MMPIKSLTAYCTYSGYVPNLHLTTGAGHVLCMCFKRRCTENQKFSGSRSRASFHATLRRDEGQQRDMDPAFTVYFTCYKCVKSASLMQGVNQSQSRGMWPGLNNILLSIVFIHLRQLSAVAYFA